MITKVIRRAALAVLLLPVGVAAGSEEIERREVRFRSGGVELAGTVLVPPGERPTPGVVIVHGSGSSDRSNPWTSAWAEALAARGVAVLHPDKRGSGESGGDWRTVGFDVLVADAVAAVETLGRLPEVDADRTGVIGFSQGGHIAPAVATESETVRFVGSISASVVPLVEQIVDEVELAAERAGLDAGQVAEVTALHRSAIHYATTGAGWERYATEREAALDTPIGPVVEPFPDDPDDWVWSWGRAVGNFDPLVHWIAADVPRLLVYGGADERIRVGESVGLVRDHLVGPGENTVLLVFGSNGHGLYRDDAADLIARWVASGGTG